MLLCGFIWSLSHSWTIGSSKVPSLGKFLSPASGFWANAENNNSFPNINVDLKTPSGKTVNISFDERLVPHIFATSKADAYFAQGYVTALHRLWQMDLATKATEGRISEIIGPDGLNFDRNKRQIGMGYAAERSHEEWKKDTVYYALLENYADGVNAYIESLNYSRLPLEYKLMRFSPEKWSPYRSVVFLKSMALDLCGQHKDLEFTNTKRIFGDKIFNELFNAFDSKQIPIIPSNDTAFTALSIDPESNNPINLPLYQRDLGAEESESFFSKTLVVEENSNASFDELNDIQLGSNNWVLSGKKTASGAPILANDPHLKLSLPSIWYECHIVLPDYQVYGVSLPGNPGIIIGFNENIAWGPTNAGHDVTDWYKIDWVDDNHSEYYLDGQKKKVENRIEVYKIKGEKSIIDTIPYSVWGPIYTSGNYAGMAMKWIAHDALNIKEGSAFSQLNSATDFESFKSALNDHASPAQNVVFASKNGDIGLKIMGKLPLLKKDQGVYIQDGSKSENKWEGFIPGNENPFSFNPSQNYLASSNQVTTDSTYPYYYHGEPYFEDFRGRIANERLQRLDKATIEDMMALQYNSISLKAKDILPTFISYLNDFKLADQGQEILTSLTEWNYSYDFESKNPIYFNLWYTEFYKLTWDEFYQFGDSTPVLKPESWRTIELAIKEPNYPYFDMMATQDKKENVADIIQISFLKMIEKVNESEKSNIKDWGKYRNTKINHLASLPGFSREIYNTPGWADALNAISSQNGPSWRMIVEMTDPLNARVIYPGGQNGNPGSKFYDNMIDDWTAGNYYEPHFTRNINDLKEYELFELQIGTK